MSKKNIDKFFQERFKDFEQVPDEKVWNAIEASLNGKKKKRIIPLWWKLGGVAAILALALIALNHFNTHEVENDNYIITDTQKVEDEDSGARTGNDNDSFSIKENSGAAVVNSSTDVKEIDSITHSQTPESVATGDQNAQETRRSFVAKSGISSSDTLNSNDRRLTETKGNEGGAISKTSISEEVVNSDFNVDKDRNPLSNPNAPEQLEPSIDKEGDALAAEFQNEARKKESRKPIVKNDIERNSEGSVTGREDQDVEGPQEGKKKSILEAIADESEEEVTSDERGGRWSAGPNIAPVYFNGFGQGSPVHSSFAQNTKSGNTNLSYGLSVAYQVNRKLRVRSGINKVNYGYDTDDVAFSSALQASADSQIKNIDYSSTAKNLVVKSESNSFSNLELASNNFALDASSANSASRDGVMAQQFGYLEIPVEIDYALIESKLGLNVVGGVSSYFLLDNSVSLTSGELTTEIGEANNINTVNFSTNIGFGVNYRFTPKIRLNIEPVFKYQLNTFSNVSGDFRPYSIGVYSGLNYRF
ncbi:outer membrane beta-barrel protein [Pareuzebyella sediminis]|uniref:outer membrane beta-barrel protein n=1 Tax=Pareuzebyella sediminis TaxID=2607998 RepID=UPI0011ED52DE|nr:outer membrane beta-barrel protein [Pareuzebyella sediminis]